MKVKFLTFWLAGVLSTVLALPYIFALQEEVLKKAPMSLTHIAIISVLQSALLLAIAVFIGLQLADKIGLQTIPFFDSKESLREKSKHIFKLGIPIGIVVALLIKLGDLFFVKYIPELVATAQEIPFWKALLVAPYGGIVEELLMRLCIVTLVAWLIGKVTRVKEVTKSAPIMWTAITVSAVLFGLGHLPATANIVPLTPIVILRAILLNGIGGIAFGWLYWKKGLAYSIVAHFTTDIVLHVLLFSLLKI